MSFKAPSSLKPIVYAATLRNDGTWRTVINSSSNEIVQIDSIKLAHGYNGRHTVQLRGSGFAGGTNQVFLDQILFDANTLIASQAETPIYLTAGASIQARIFDEDGFISSPSGENLSVVATGWVILE